VGEIILITGVGPTSAGGTATVAPGGTSITYTPASNFFGTETFTYTISDDHGGTDTATVTVTVNPVNDPPTAVDDNLLVQRNTAENTLGVLANDTIAPDADETLTVTDVGTPDNGGMATITSGGGSITYTPAEGFSGIETFTYTISDGHGGSDTATVTVRVNAPPDAVDDPNFVVDEDSPATELDVLANDSIAPDVGETLLITGVGPTSAGGTAAISAGGTRISYAPAANFHGTESFTYTAVTIDVLANDMDDGAIDPTTLMIITQPMNGTASVDSVTHMILYTPNSSTEGFVDFIEYTIRDNEGLESEPALVSIVVGGIIMPGPLAGGGGGGGGGAESSFAMWLTPDGATNPATTEGEASTSGLPQSTSSASSNENDIVDTALMALVDVLDPLGSPSASEDPEPGWPDDALDAALLLLN
jgi:hypothetical protein